MTLEEAIYAQLKSTDPVTAIVGTAAAARIWPQVLAQGPDTAGQPKYPALVYRRISGPRDHHLTGPSGLAMARIEISAYSKSYGQAKTLINAVRVALDGFSGTLGGVGGVATSPILAEDERDFYDDEEEAHVVQLDLICWHAES